MIRGKQGRNKAEILRIRAEEAALRRRLAQEKAAAEAERSQRIKRKWKAAFHTLRAQNIFLDRYRRIHNSHVMAAEAKRKAEEDALRREEEAAALKAKREAAAAIRIQASYRGLIGRQTAKQRAAIVTADAAAKAAAIAAQESVPPFVSTYTLPL